MGGLSRVSRRHPRRFTIRAVGSIREVSSAFISVVNEVGTGFVIGTDVRGEWPLTDAEQQF